MVDLCMYHTFLPVVANIRSQDSFSGNPMTVFSFLFSDAFFSGWFRIFASPVRGSPLALQPSVADCCVTPQIATTLNTAHRTGTMACRAAPAGERTSESGRAVVRRPAFVESPAAPDDGGSSRIRWRAFARVVALRAVAGVLRARLGCASRWRTHDQCETTTRRHDNDAERRRPEGRQA